jgi:hypothetical protein
VQAVRQQRHGAVNDPGRNLHDHHRSCQDYDGYGTTLARTLFVLAKDVVMRPVAQLLRIHDDVTPSKWIAEKANAGNVAIIRFGCVRAE